MILIFNRRQWFSRKSAMEFSAVEQLAINVRKKYEIFELKKYGSSWDVKDLMIGFQGDVGDLAKLIQASQGNRNISGWKEKLEHELSDCLWSLIVLSNKLDINFEEAFVRTMKELDDSLTEK